MSPTPKAEVAQRVEVLVIGAGISGIGAAVRLLGEGCRDFVVLEKAESIGGTWRDNTYPGCACDVPSALYSYSFAQRHDWSRVFAGQAEILDYLRDVTEQHGLAPWLRFGEAVSVAHWDADAGHWRVESAKARYQARMLIVCTGYLHQPRLPQLPGLEHFPGKVFHSSRWDHDHDLRGQRVAVIGSGASAVQFVPAIQPQVASLALFQRTPHWVLPKPDHPIPAIERWLLGLPGGLAAYRTALYAAFETFGIGFRRPLLLKLFQRLARLQLRWQVRDPALRQRLTPRYTLGCKRVLLSNDYYPALTQPNVSVHATGLRGIEGRRLIGEDGTQCEVDTLIFATGFEVTEQPIAACLHGADGRSLAAHWDGSPQAYRGSTVKGFPNLFLVLGPNLAIGHNSAFIVIEAQLDYAMGALRAMRQRGLGRLEISDGVQARYNDVVQQALRRTVWNTGGCASYYLDRNGRNSTGFPWSTLEMRRLLRDFDLDAYHTEPASAPALEAQV